MEKVKNDHHRIFSNFFKLKSSWKEEAPIFSGFFFPTAEVEKYTAMIILHFHLHPQYKYELFHNILHIIMETIISCVVYLTRNNKDSI